MKTSLIIASYCRPELLDLGLWSLSQQKIDHDFEIIVCNDGENDATEAVCNKYNETMDIRYIFTGQRNIIEKKHRVAGFALNIGVKQCSGDIIILSCAEIFHLNDTINQIIDPLLYSKKLLTTPAVMYFDDEGSGVKYLSSNLTRKLPIELEIDLRKNSQYIYATQMPFLMGMYKKEYWNIGGYDEDFIGYAADDNDLLFRLLFTGLKYHYIQGQIIHLYHGVRCDSKVHPENPEWTYNYNLFKTRKEQKIIIRNQNREWGVIC